ncbi:MAG: response regulator transcription factor [Proteobacteria bacterium]|nr:response regulator transcription factor [Pseudomonadota bacterium]
MLMTVKAELLHETPPSMPGRACIEAVRGGHVSIAWISVSRLARECMTDAIARESRFFRIESFDTAISCIKLSKEPLDLVVYHANGTDMADLQEITRLRRALASSKLLVISDQSTMSSEVVREILAEGAAGLVLANSNSIQMLASAISLVISGGTFIPKEYVVDGWHTLTRGRGLGVDTHRRLTPREQSVLALIREGKPNKVIATQLGTSVCTVKVHARNLMRKMGAANRTQAAMIANKLP